MTSKGSLIRTTAIIAIALLAHAGPTRASPVPASDHQVVQAQLVPTAIGMMYDNTAILIASIPDPGMSAGTATLAQTYPATLGVPARTVDRAAAPIMTNIYLASQHGDIIGVTADRSARKTNQIMIPSSTALAGIASHVKTHTLAAAHLGFG
jgi:hypothetical protein